MHDNTYSGVPYDSDDLFGSAIHCAGGLFIDTTSTNSSCPGAFAYLNLYSNDGVDFYLPKGIKRKERAFLALKLTTGGMVFLVAEVLLL